VVCADEKRAEQSYGARGKNLYCIQDTAAAIQNILLTVFSLGLGSCWIGAFKEDEIRKVIKAPKNMKPVALVPIGVPNEAPAARSRQPVKRDNAQRNLLTLAKTKIAIIKTIKFKGDLATSAWLYQRHKTHVRTGRCQFIQTCATCRMKKITITSRRKRKEMLSRDCDGCSQMKSCNRRYFLVEKGNCVYCPDGTAHLVDGL
jgi:hypothetical protein